MATRNSAYNPCGMYGLYITSFQHQFCNCFWIFLVAFAGVAIIQFFAVFYVIWIDQHQFDLTSLQICRQWKPVVPCKFKPYYDAVLLLFGRQLQCSAQKEVKTFCAVLKFDCLTQFKAAPIECSLTGDIHADYYYGGCDLTNFSFCVAFISDTSFPSQRYSLIRALTLIYFDCKEVSLFVQTQDFLLFTGILYRIVVISVPLLSYMLHCRDIVDWCAFLTTRWFWKDSNYTPDTILIK